MSDEYTPDEEQVREQYTREQPPQIGTVSARRAEFNRMIAKVKAEAQVEALRMASDELTLSFSRGMVLATATECHKKQCRCGNPAPEELARQIALAYRDQIRDEADRIARGAGIETGESNE